MKSSRSDRATHERTAQDRTEGRHPTSRGRILYVVATVHLDTQWRWTVQDTIRDFLPATMRENLALFERYPFFVLSFEGAFRYMLMKEYYPQDFERLREFVGSGRWRVAGSMLDAADVNVVSPESLIRHILYGTRFFEREFGRTSRDLFLPDCFGFGWALPSIGAHCGLKGFSSSKFGKYIAPGEIPFDIGVWRGPDGAEILAALRPEGYGEGLREDLSRADRWQRRIDQTGGQSGAYVGYMYVGVGDRGGALDEESMTWLAQSLEGSGAVEVRNTASDQLYSDLTPEQIERLPRHESELLLPTHGTGCYTSQAIAKRWNRKNELLADVAERAAVIAAWLGILPYPSQRLTDAWIRFLWHQMHDDLTGTSIPEAYRFTWNDQLIALNQFSAVLRESVGAIASALDTQSSGVPLVVFNPLAREREDLVMAKVRAPSESPRAVRVFDSEDKEVPAQIGPANDGNLHVVFLARVPALGLSVFSLEWANESCELATGLDIGDRYLENHRYRVEIDDRGDIRSVIDKTLETDLLGAPVHFELLPDHSSRWPAWEIRHEDLAQPGLPVLGLAQIRILESGPARVSLEIERAFRGSTYVERLRLAAGEAGNRLEIDTRIDWRTRGRLLKTVFPLATSNPAATYDLGLGAISRSGNTRVRYEVPAQQWADLSSPDGRLGISILSDSKYGWDKPDESTLRLTLLRSPRTVRKFRHQAVQDLGPHRCGYALVGHAGSWREADTPWQALQFNQPLRAFQTLPHSGPLGRSFSFLRLDSEQVQLRALKQAEDSDELLVRMQETGGKGATEVSLELATPITGARQVDGCERSNGEARVEAGRLNTVLSAFSPGSFALRAEPCRLSLPGPTSVPVALPFDVVATSFHDHHAPGDFDGSGRTYPGELFPPRVQHGGVDFDLGPAEPGSTNAMACRGQVLELPSGSFGRLHFLAAATTADTTAQFRLHDQQIELRIQHYSGIIGCWKGWRWTPWGLRWSGSRPGFVKRDAIAWLATHRHDRSGKDEPYVTCYLFRYWLDLPAGAHRLELPDKPAIRLFALSLSDELFTDTVSAFDPYDYYPWS